MSIDSIHSFIALVAAAVIAVMAACLVFVMMPRGANLANYRASRYMLAAGYLVFSAATLFALHAGPDVYGTGPLVLTVTVITAGLSAFLFQHTILTLINPMFLTVRRLAATFIPIALTVCALLAAFMWGSQRIFDIAFYLSAGLYFLLLYIYIKAFRREYGDYVMAVNNFFSDDSGLHLKWVRTAYYLAVGMGALAGVSLFLPSAFFVGFIAFVAVFYVYYAVRYIDYGRMFAEIAPAFEPVYDEVGAASANTREVAVKIGGWIEAKGFLAGGTTLDSMSRELGLPCSEVSAFHRSQSGRSFRRWITELRMEEAREMIMADPDISLHEVARRVGMPRYRRFVSAFSDICGESPRDFRERLRRWSRS